MIMRPICVQDMAQSALPTQHKPPQCVLFDRSPKAFRTRLQLGRPRRQRYAVDARIVEHLLEGGTELGVAVVDEILTRLQAPRMVK